MALTLSPKALSELVPTDIVFQTAFWGQVKSHLGWKPLAFDIGGSVSRGDVLVLTHSFGNGLERKTGVCHVSGSPQKAGTP